MVLAPVWVTYTLRGLWQCFGWTPNVGVSRSIGKCWGEVLGASKVCTGTLCEETCSHPGKFLLKLGWRGSVHRSTCGHGALLAN